MAKPPRPWIVTKPVTLSKLEDNVWAVESPVPGGPGMNRRMTIVKLSDGRLVFLDAVPVEDAQLAEIRAWGTPAFLVVSHGGHRIDIHAFRDKLGVKVLCPELADAKVRERVTVDGHLDALPRDPALSWIPVGGSKLGEAWFLATSPGGRVTVHSADAFMNIPKGGGNFLLRLMGFSGGPKVVPVFKTMFVNDKAALRASYEKVIATPGVVRVIPCHGEMVEKDAVGALRTAMSTI
jgi:hypothetical protein